MNVENNEHNLLTYYFNNILLMMSSKRHCLLTPTGVVLGRQNTSSVQGPATNFVVIWKTDVKRHADEYTYVKIKTGNRITIRRPSVFLNLNLPPSMEWPLSVMRWYGVN